LCSVLHATLPSFPTRRSSDLDRLQRPLIRKSGQWEEVDWHEALEFVGAGLKGKDLGVLASPHSTLEELYLAGKLGTADFRLRHSDRKSTRLNSSHQIISYAVF